MKNIVIYDEFNEIDLKPTKLLSHYVKLVEDDILHLVVDRGNLKDTLCPACGKDNGRKAFLKFGLWYRECPKCQTLFISPRPSDDVLNSFYKEAKSRMFFRDQMSKVSDKKRKEKIIKPRFLWVMDSTQEYLPRAEHWIDINTGWAGYVDEMVISKSFKRQTLLNPHLNKKDWPLDPNVRIIDQPWWEGLLNDKADIITIFEVADHTSDMVALFTKIDEILKPGGLCFMTAILSSGFDIQVLWDKADNLFPPDRLNVFSVEGLKILFDRFSFDCLEFSTPGILDVDIVARKIKENPSIDIPRFERGIIESKDENFKMQFQRFLQANLLSSYGRILLKKRNK